MAKITMSPREREEFLAAVHVGVLCVPGGGAPVCSPIWYNYEPGQDMHVLLDPASRKGKLLHPGAEVTMVVQNETQPYAYASVQGSVSSISPASREEHLRPLARRYLGDEMGDAYTEASPIKGAVRVSIRPARWLTADFAKLEGAE